MATEVGWTNAAAYPNAPKSASQARPRPAAATRIGSRRRSARENVAMAAVSQGLLEFANEFRTPAAPGVEQIETPRYRITLVPDYPIPGPNGVTWIRCAPVEADSLITEVRAIVKPRGLPLMWTLDPGTEPANFAEYLAARGVYPEPHAPEVKVMVLPADASLVMPVVDGLEIRDALATRIRFAARMP